MRRATAPLALALFAGCHAPPPSSGGGEYVARIGTAAQRAELFEELVQKTMAREAFSEVKHRRLGLDVEQAMRACRDELVSATNERELFVALSRLSCARRDRHLIVRSTPGGLRFENGNRGASPLRFEVDFGDSHGLFVAMVPASPETQHIAIGDEVIAVGGRPLDEWARAISPYLRSSTEAGRWLELAKALGVRSGTWPRELESETANYTLRRRDGHTYDVRLPWRDAPTPAPNHAYPGEAFERVLATNTFDLHRHTEAPVLLLDWHEFGPDLERDTDRLIALAEDRRWLDHDLIWDGTRSAGGSNAAYILQRLFSRPFRTTFGNLRLSDVTPLFIAAMRRRHSGGGILGLGLFGTNTKRSWLMEWLEEDVTVALARGDAYSNDVPFKSAHLPKDSDGVLRPAEVHFSGRVVCLFGPHGGSHVDQFASMVIDNDLAHTIGMSTGGYSNTWEWEEVVRMPGTDTPLVRYMWSIGQTLRPSGEVLEGNPPEVREWAPVTRETFADYRASLVRRALTFLGR